MTQQLVLIGENGAVRPVVKCPLCGEEVRIVSFSRHLWDKHIKRGGKDATCSVCGAKLRGSDALRHHRTHLIGERETPSGKVYRCLVCGREFVTRTSALTHVAKAHER